MQLNTFGKHYTQSIQLNKNFSHDKEQVFWLGITAAKILHLCNNYLGFRLSNWHCQQNRKKRKKHKFKAKPATLTLLQARSHLCE